MNIPDFWSTIDRIHAIPEAAAGVFDLLQNIVGGSLSAVTADNYEFAVELLNSFANAKVPIPVVESKPEPNARRQKTSKQIKSQQVIPQPRCKISFLRIKQGA